MRRSICRHSFLPDNTSLSLQGIRDVQFSNDGHKFLSTGYDKVIKLWDTETGQVIRTFGEGKMFFTAKFHPNDDKQNVLMAGCQDKKVGAYLLFVDTWEYCKAVRRFLISSFFAQYGKELMFKCAKCSTRKRACSTSLRALIPSTFYIIADTQARRDKVILLQRQCQHLKSISLVLM